jgi:replicative superfamily II helicase
MSLIVRCVGVDRHRDPRVPDLTGARRDATAVWALVRDTLPGADARLVADADATAEAIRRVLGDTLGAAGPDDDVLLMFAGHGTHDHRLVAHDTTPDAYEATTVPMRDLAALFRTTRARSVVCVLDCCFSGAAPARVLEDTPASRDLPVDASAFGGAGRVMITASRLDEPAYEHPRRRHGLLSNALITVLTRAGAGEAAGTGAAVVGAGTVSLATAMDEVLALVRADAAAMGCTQTPQLLGLIDGGLTMPALRRGAHFLAAFPETGRPAVGPAVADLAAYDLPPAALAAWAEAYPAGLNALQVAAVNEYGVLAGDSALVVAPTSAGKTLIGELAAVRAVADGRKAVFLLPYRALVNEKYDQFASRYGAGLGLRVVRCTGDYADQRAAFVNGKYDLALLTFEMFLALAVGNRAVLPRVGLVVLDEAQFIADPGRGITVELLLTLLRAARDRGVAPQLLALSATIGALNHFDDWLGLRALVSDRRPVPLEFGVLDRTGTFEVLTADGRRETRQLLPRHAVVQRRQKASSQDVLVPLVRQLIADPDARERVLVFRNQRGAAEGCANYLAADLGLPSAAAVLADLPTLDRSSASEALRRALAGGAAFHTSDLNREERAAVERAFRDPGGAVRVLAATMTVAAGVNTPASTVVIVEHGFPWANQAYTVGEVRNMAGRAGRLGLRETGRAILLADTPLERRRLFDTYVATGPEPVRSSFTGEDVGTWLIRLFAQVEAVPADAVAGLLANTFGGYLAARRDPAWPARTAAAAADLVRRMEAQGLLERDADGRLRLTLLGRACGQSSLALASALRVVELVRRPRAGGLTPMALMALVQALPEMDDGPYTPLVKRGQGEARWPREAAAVFGDEVARALQERAPDFHGYYGRAKRACLLDAWARGVPVAEIERAFTANPFSAVSGGSVRAIADATRFHLRSAAAIAQVAAPGASPDPDGMEELLRQLEAGLPADALDLLALGLPLARGEYLALAAAGLRTAAGVRAAPRAALAAVLGQGRVRDLQLGGAPVPGGGAPGGAGAGAGAA